MAARKLAPALSAVNCVVLKSAEQTPASICVLMDLIGDVLPPRVINIVQGFGLEAGKPLASSSRVAKVVFTGETSTGRLIMQYASQNLIPVTLELGGKSPNVFFEGMPNGNYIEPTIFKGHNSMRVFQEEIFGPVVSVTTFKDEAEAIAIANDTLYGLGAGVWLRNANRCFRAGRSIHAGRVWTNCYHAYPEHAACGGYKQSGIGRENHKMMLNHYRHIKNLLVSYNESKLGFF